MRIICNLSHPHDLIHGNRGNVSVNGTRTALTVSETELALDATDEAAEVPAIG